jgi:hypothetical protein
MKIAVVSESPADEAAVKILVDAVLGIQTEVVADPRFRPGGWSHVLKILPSMIASLHYYTAAEAMVVVLDSDDSTIHDFQSSSAICSTDCRLCGMRTCIEESLRKLTPVPNKDALLKGVGLAVPSIEAWYRCGIDSHVNEATWARHLGGESIPFDRKTLKRDTYGTNIPNLVLETEVATRCASRLAENLDQLEQLFPIGFGCLVADLRSWSA